MSHQPSHQPCVLLCVTGCIAAYKACEITRLLQKAGVRVKVLMTDHAMQFVGPTTFRALTGEKVACGLFDDPEDPIHHISLAQEADLVLVAPATANIIAKMAHGLADDLLSTTLLATKGPIAIAPAMNTGMWEAAATQENIETIKRRGCQVIKPVDGRLACGDVGSGKLAPVDDIVDAALRLLRGSNLLSGRSVLITAAGTQEPIDPVRFIGNRSSGKFGYALARAARDLGASVTLVSGPSSLAAPSGVERIDVGTAAEMYDAVDSLFTGADLLICAAAVADYTPAHTASHKLKKTYEHLDAIELVETKDILAAMAAKKGERVVVGFAAETNDLLDYARSKLVAKKCDAIVANDVSQPHSTFGADTDKVWWITADGDEELPLARKEDLGYAIIQRAAKLLP